MPYWPPEDYIDRVDQYFRLEQYYINLAKKNVKNPKCKQQLRKYLLAHKRKLESTINNLEYKISAIDTILEYELKDNKSI